MKEIALALLFVGIALSLYLEHNDWPSVYHHDEPSKVAQLQRNERNFNHPLFLLEASDAVRRLCGVSREDEEGILACGRFVSALCMAGAIGFLALAAINRSGGMGGIMVGVVGILCFRFYEVGHYFKEDTPYLLGIAVSLWALTTSKHSALLLGLGVGLAASSKYVGITLLPLGLILVRKKQPFLIAFLCVVIVVHLRLLFMESPLRTMLSSLAQETSWLALGHKGIGSSIPNFAYLERFAYELGFHGLILLGLWGIFRKQLTREDRVILTYAAIYFLILLFTRKYSERYLLPVHLVALYFVGLQMASLIERAAGLGWNRRLVAAAIFLLVFLPWYPWLASHREAFAHDSRSGLCRILATTLPADAVIVADAAAEIEAAQRWQAHPLSSVRIAEYVPLLGSIADLKAQGVTHIVICYDTYYRFLSSRATIATERQAEWEACRAFYARLKEESPIWQAPPRDPKPLHPGLELYAMPAKL